MLYGARANTGIDRMKIINAVAKSIPAPHTVDLTNPTRAIVVEIVKVSFALLNLEITVSCFFSLRFAKKKKKI